jgi:hypothetical protein
VGRHHPAVTPNSRAEHLPPVRGDDEKEPGERNPDPQYQQEQERHLGNGDARAVRERKEDPHEEREAEGLAWTVSWMSMNRIDQ